MLRYILLLFIVLAKCSSAQLNQPEYVRVVKQFKQQIAKNNVDELKKIISYPLHREYPLTNIQNETSFRKNFKEIMDQKLRNIIMNSDTKKDWTHMGWRGIMLNQGIVWLDTDGKLIGLNYESNKATRKREKLIEEDKLTLPPALRGFQKPIHILKTKSYLIRIDQLSTYEYRYISWPIGSNFRTKPILILYGGQYRFDGSGGNHAYVFSNGNHIYECQINVLRNYETSVAELIVYEKENLLLRESATIQD